MDHKPEDDTEASKGAAMKYEVRDATGADWVWAMTYPQSHDGNTPPPEMIVARLVDGMTEQGALDLSARVFAGLFQECTRSLYGDPESD